MSAFLVALGLVFVIEGLLFAAFPGPAQRAAHALTETPEHTLRVVGVVSAALGVGLIWLIRVLS